MHIRTRHVGLLFIALVAALALAGVLTLWIVYPEVNVTKEGVKLALERVINRPIALKNVRIGFSPTTLFDITVEGLAIEFPEAESRVSIRSANLKPSLASLLKLEVLFSSITVEGLHASVTLGPEGAATALPLPLPFGGVTAAEDASGKERTDQVGSQGGQGPTPPPLREPSPTKLRIDFVRIVDARIDFLSPGENEAKSALVSISDISGELRKETEEARYSFQFKGNVVADKTRSPFHSHGLFALADQAFPVAEAQIEISADSAPLGPWSRMFSSIPLNLDAVTAERLNITSSFQAGKPLSVVLGVSLKERAGRSASLNAEADIQPSRSFDAIDAIKVKTQIRDLPVELLEDVFAERLPTLFTAGFIHGEIQGSWQGRGFSTTGVIQLESLVPGLTFLAGPAPWSGTVEWEGNSSKITLHKANIASNDTSLSLSGDLVEPFSKDVSFNVECRGRVGSSLIAAGIARSLAVSGTMGVSAHIKGVVDDLGLDVNSDLSGVALEKAPFFRKKAGTSAAAHFTGRIVKTSSSAGSGRRLEGLVKGTLASVSLGKDATLPSSLNVRTEFQAKMVADAASIGLREALVTLARPDSSHKIFSMTGDVSNLASASPSFQFQSKITLDKDVLAAFSILPNNVTLNGSASAACKFSGSAKAVRWDVNAALNTVEVKVGGATLKQPGAPGSLSAVGSWQDGELILTRGELTIPGVLANARGTLLDRRGSFQHLDVEVKKADLAQIGKQLLSPAYAMTGALAGSLKIQPVEHSIAAAGSLHLANVGLAVNKPNRIGCSGLKGVIEIQGATARAEELTGALTGLVTAPVKLKGRIDGLYSLDSMNGEVFVETGKGKIRTDFLAAATAMGDVLGPRAAVTQQLLEITAGTASIRISSGKAETQDLRVKGPTIAVGAMGSYLFKDSSINALLSIQTRMFENLPIGDIPVVRDFLKQHEGFLKAIGVDKELSKYGIRLPQAQQGQSTTPTPQNIPPVTVMFTLRGPISKPQMLPVLESSLDKSVVERLKKLSEL
jgi:hypothetical protein